MFEITLTGIKKHVQVLERSGLVTTEKVGRVRTCKLCARPLEEEATWIASYRKILEERFDRLEVLLERTKGEDHEHNRSRSRSKGKNHPSRRS
jgi:DNA-binding transcriptional ArsR family regulator